MATEVVASARRIIPRPRLTKLLDENPARIKLLVAPAGYGKTTLAQQWLSAPERRDVWYRAGPAAADVAALAAGLAIAASNIIPDAGKRMRERIRAVGHSEEDVDVLADLFAEDIQEWPSDAWLAIDDYHFAMESAASERFIDLLTQQAPAQLLITSRRRPAWATARRVIYGEIQELDRGLLAMSEDEAREVLGRRDGSVVGLLRQAAGWPAVIGLAALSRPASLRGTEPPTALYDYLAEEVVSTPDVEIQQRLAALALARRFDAALAEALLDQRAAETIEEGLRSGVLEADTQGMYEVHPLLGEFLETQLRIHEGEARSTARTVARCLLDRGRVDEAFDLAARFEDTVTTEEVLASSLDRLLREGRVATITRWLERSPLAYSTSPVVSLADAEKEFRQGQHARALELAASAVSRLGSDSPLSSRALARAGQSALMANRETEALGYFERAHATARTVAEIREALMGSYLVSSELGLDVASDHITALTNIDDASPETSLRTEVARLLQATRSGGIAAAIEHALPERRLVDGAADPLASTAFLQMLANALSLAGRYDEATDVVDALIAIANRYRMVFPLPYARLNQALARHGRREYSAAHAALNLVDAHVGRTDVYLEFSARAIRARLLTSEQRIDEALEEVAPTADAISSPPLVAEYLASRALVHSIAGKKDSASRCANEAQAAYPTSVEARVIGACVDAVNEGENPIIFRHKVSVAWDIAQETGNIDGIVCAYRAWPPLLQALFEAGAHMDAVVVEARDVPLTRRLGIRIRQPVRPASVLTPREAEVFELLRSGLTNRAIAEVLFVSESTVKAHLRHIYEKLGVRSRAQALAQTLRQ